MKTRWIALATAGGALAAVSGFAVRAARTKPSLPLAPGYLRDVDGVTIHYRDEGAGSPVVLIHGFAGNTFSWRNAIPPLAETHRVIALDLPGWGYSDRSPEIDFSHEGHAALVVRFLDSLGLEKVVLIGHSMGGGVAQRVAAAHPERVSHLVLVASVDASEPPDSARRRSLPAPMFAAIDTATRSKRLMYAAGRRSLRQITSNPECSNDEAVEGYMAPLLIPGTVAALRKMTASVGSDPLVDLAQISVPTMVVTGVNDTVVRTPVGVRLAAGIPGACLVEIPNAGHLLAEEQPEVFLRELETFLAAPAG